MYENTIVYGTYTIYIPSIFVCKVFARIKLRVARRPEEFLVLRQRPNDVSVRSADISSYFITFRLMK